MPEKKAINSSESPSKLKNVKIGVNTIQAGKKPPLMRKEKIIEIENVNDFNRPYSDQSPFKIPQRILQRPPPSSLNFTKSEAFLSGKEKPRRF